VIYLTAEELLHVATRAIGGKPIVRDRGLLESSAHRPQATAFGEDAYPALEEKAAALMQSLAKNHPLVDGNKRLALAGTIAFLGVNGVRLTMSNDEAYDLVIAVVTDQIPDVEELARRIARSSAPW